MARTTKQNQTTYKLTCQIVRDRLSVDDIEWLISDKMHGDPRMDELAVEFQRTHDKKIMAQISALSRLLAKMDGRLPDPKNRQ